MMGYIFSMFITLRTQWNVFAKTGFVHANAFRAFKKNWPNVFVIMNILGIFYNLVVVFENLIHFCSKLSM